MAQQLILRTFALAVLTFPVLTAQTFECRGEEPFWYVELDDSAAKLSRPGVPEQRFAGKMQRLAFLRPPWLIWRSASKKTKEPLVIILRQEACYSTMADGPPAPYRALLSLGPGDAATGCCNLRAKSAGLATIPAVIATPSPSLSRNDSRGH